MRCFPRSIIATALALSLHGVTFAQTQAPVPPSTTVQQLAPQLVTFAGSQANFESLVNGLAFGTPVQLVTVLPDGSTQTATFTPTGSLSTVDIARTLEAARQQLISLGIAAPTAAQISAVLQGNTVPSATVQAQRSAGAGATSVTPVQPVPTPADLGTPAAATGSVAGAPAAPNATPPAVKTTTPPPGSTPLLPRRR